MRIPSPPVAAAFLLSLVIGLCGIAPAAAADNKNLTEADVKTVFEQSVRPSIGAKFVWRSVQIAQPRKITNPEARAAGIKPGTTIWPVRVDYTQVIGDGGRDYKWNYFFYKDGDFGNWARQSNAVTGNIGSDLYYIKPGTVK